MWPEGLRSRVVGNWWVQKVNPRTPLELKQHISDTSCSQNKFKTILLALTHHRPRRFPVTQGSNIPKWWRHASQDARFVDLTAVLTSGDLVEMESTPAHPTSSFYDSFMSHEVRPNFLNFSGRSCGESYLVLGYPGTLGAKCSWTGSDNLSWQPKGWFPKQCVRQAPMSFVFAFFSSTSLLFCGHPWEIEVVMCSLFVVHFNSYFPDSTSLTYCGIFSARP